MKNKTYAIITMIAIFTIILTVPERIFAQKQINSFVLDTTNAEFKNVSTDTTTGVVTILMKIDTGLIAKIKEYKNATISYSFKMYGSMSVDQNIIFIQPTHKVLDGIMPSLELSVNEIVLNGEETKLELKFKSLNSLNQTKDPGMLPDDKMTLEVKIKSVILNN